MIDPATAQAVLEDLLRAHRLLALGDGELPSLDDALAAVHLARRITDPGDIAGATLYRDTMLALGAAAIEHLAELTEAGCPRWQPLIPMNGVGTTVVAAVTKACD